MQWLSGPIFENLKTPGDLTLLGRITFQTQVAPLGSSELFVKGSPEQSVLRNILWPWGMQIF